MKRFNFSIPLTIRVSDLNYGNHVGYQNFFSFFQEARIAYLAQFEYSELDIGGCGFVVSEANCRYQQELFLNDAIQVACCVSQLKSKLFMMEYQVSKTDQICAQGFTKNLCYDYTAKKVAHLPEAFATAVRNFEDLP